MNWVKRILGKLNIRQALIHFIEKEDIPLTIIGFLGLVMSMLLMGLWFVNLGISDAGARLVIITNLMWMIPSIIGNNEIQKIQNKRIEDEENN